LNIVLFCHSLLSDWNNGNAHFLRGLSTELGRRGHTVSSYEPEDAWSVEGLLRERGELPIEELGSFYPELTVHRYRRTELDLEEVLDGADLVIVHEWNDPELVRAVGRHRRTARYRLLFHDTHHRSVTDPGAFSRLPLAEYDGVLAFGEAVRQAYVSAGWADRVYTFHEAADTRVFRPFPGARRSADVVFVGNFGDDERTAEIDEFLLGPVAALRARTSVYGVRYPDEARARLARAGATYGGWLPNYRAPDVFARHKATVHVPRRPYARALPGVPTIRVFEALACGIPLLSAPWDDVEGLFRPDDYVKVETGAELGDRLAELLADESVARELARRGRETILARHTCVHRAEQLEGICRELGLSPENPARHADKPHRLEATP
jgi:spore maturation protein CgeB